MLFCWVATVAYHIWNHSVFELYRQTFQKYTIMNSIFRTRDLFPSLFEKAEGTYTRGPVRENYC